MRAYEESTRPLAEYYERARTLVPVQALGPPEKILGRSLQALNQRLATAALR
jgi:adenylate kinase